MAERWTKCSICNHRSSDHGFSGRCWVEGCNCTAFVEPDTDDHKEPKQ